jgi:hypothetical protein
MVPLRDALTLAPVPFGGELAQTSVVQAGIGAKNGPFAVELALRRDGARN